MLYYFVSSHFMPFHVIPCHFMLYHIMSYSNVPVSVTSLIHSLSISRGWENRSNNSMFTTIMIKLPVNKVISVIPPVLIAHPRVDLSINQYKTTK